jgi:peptidoglycan hydrolase-like protein with peptidoglycan-binding domain
MKTSNEIRKIKLAAAISLAALVFMGSAGVALAQTDKVNESLVSQISALLQKVKSLQDQITAADTQKSELKGELQETMKLTRSLQLGMTSDEVKVLQEMLATDPDIYPEGKVTGYFGSLTEKAVKKFQARFGLEQVGKVGPKTLAKINELLTEGAGNSGKIPPGLLKASGIAKKLNEANTTTSTNSGVPVITNVFAVNTATNTAYVYWTTNEKTTSTLWYATSTPLNLASAAKITSSSLKTVHSAGLSGLQASTTYYYKIEVSDAEGNQASTTQYSFVTR